MYGPSCVCSSNIHLCAVVTSVIFDIFCHRTGLFLCLPQNQRSHRCCEWRRCCGLLSLTLRQEKEKDKRFISEVTLLKECARLGVTQITWKASNTHTPAILLSFFSFCSSLLLHYTSSTPLHVYPSNTLVSTENGRLSAWLSPLGMRRRKWRVSVKLTLWINVASILTQNRHKKPSLQTVGRCDASHVWLMSSTRLRQELGIQAHKQNCYLFLSYFC